jgi:hypothetical protein
MTRRVKILTDADLPIRIGPCEISSLGAMIAVRCPQDFDHLMHQAGGQQEQGTRRWLLERRRLGPLVRNLRRDTDPLFRRVGIDLDGEGA